MCELPSNLPVILLQCKNEVYRNFTVGNRMVLIVKIFSKNFHHPNFLKKVGARSDNENPWPMKTKVQLFWSLNNKCLKIKKFTDFDENMKFFILSPSVAAAMIQMLKNVNFKQSKTLEF